MSETIKLCGTCAALRNLGPFKPDHHCTAPKECMCHSLHVEIVPNEFQFYFDTEGIGRAAVPEDI